MKRFAKELLVLAVVVLATRNNKPANLQPDSTEALSPSFDKPAHHKSLPAQFRIHGVSLGCSRSQVEDVLGPPDSENQGHRGAIQYGHKYETGRQWMSFGKNDQLRHIMSNRSGTRLDVGEQTFYAGSTRLGDVLVVMGDLSAVGPTLQRWEGDDWVLRTSDNNGVLYSVALELPYRDRWR